MKSIVKLAVAASAAIAITAASASAAIVGAYCEDKGSPLAGGAHPGRCALGDTSVGTFDITTFNAGTFGNNEGLVFKGFGDNGDNDSWQFTATKAFNAFLDNFFYSGVGTNGGFLRATLTGPGGAVTNLNMATAGVFLGTFAPGTYTISILGSVLPTDIYNYDLRVEAVPVPAAAILFGSALAGVAGLRRRRKQAAA